jgi:hypothetical protein
MDIGTVLAIVSGVGPLAKSVGETVGVEVIKEVTKDGYRAFKDGISKVFGSRGTKAIARLEEQPESAEAMRSVTEMLGDRGEPSDADERQLESVFRDLRRLVDGDPVARRAAEAARIRLDVESGGHVSIEGVRGATSIDVRSRSAGNFGFRNVDMKGGQDGGN